MNLSATSEPSLFTFGCMSLGKDLDRLEDHIRVARTAMEAGVWFHASPTYNRGFTYMILRMAFDEARLQVPPMIIKIRCGSARLLRFEVEDALRRMNLERIDVAQLVFTETGHRPIVEDFTRGGPIAAVCDELRREGRVRQYCPQLTADCSSDFLPLAERGVFDGFLLYLNPLERDVDDATWGFLQRQGTPLWALRTVAGAVGEPSRLDQRRKEAPTDPNFSKAEQIAAIATKANCHDWTEFCLRYARSVPNLKTTIGGTGDLGHLNHFLSAASNSQPLPGDVMAAVDRARRG